MHTETQEKQSARAPMGHRLDAVKEWRAASVGDRSAIFFTAVRLLKAAGRSVDLIERFFAKYPNGVAKI